VLHHSGRCKAGARLFLIFDEEPGRRPAAKLLTGDEARRMATNFHKLQELSLQVSGANPFQ
jgi:hypothetical protein